MSNTSSPAPDLNCEYWHALKDVFDISPEQDGIHNIEINERVAQVKKVLFLEDEFNIENSQNQTITELHNVSEELQSTRDANSETVVQEFLVINNTNEPIENIAIPEIPSNQLQNTIQNTEILVEENYAVADDIDKSNSNINASEVDDNTVKKVKKRTAKPETWVKNLRKRKKESGEEYVNIKGKKFGKRAVREGCKPKCVFKCMEMFSFDEREQIHKQFWKLSDPKKFHFFSQCVKRQAPIRKRTKKEVSRNCNVFLYHFELNSEIRRVCKDFFLKTLDISQQRIYYFFKHVQNKETCIPRSPLKGKNVKKHTPIDKLDEVREHIASFPTIDSHYCRANSSKKYLEAILNISKMYDLYKQQYENPVGHHIYSKVFNTEFNLSFYKPKKDRCGKCEEFKAKNNPTKEETLAQEEHLRRKEEGRGERQLDRERKAAGMNEEPEVAVITFDLENVFTLPKVGIKNFFYKCKLNVYNLTAHCNTNNIVYNCIWHECNGGRAQNKNSHMTMSLKYFLESAKSDHLKIIEHKYSEPGHGNLQEVDATHSIIEKFIRNAEIASPLALIRLMLKLPNKKYKFKIIQMTHEDFCNYSVAAAAFVFSDVPYTKVKHIKYEKDETMSVQYRTSFTEDMKKITILKNNNSLRRKNRKNDKAKQLQQQQPLPKLTILKQDCTLPKLKIQHLGQMVKYLESKEDKLFYKTILEKAAPK